MNIPNKTVLCVSGGVEVKVDNPIHILHYDSLPYQRFCDNQQADIRDRSSGITAHHSEYCPTCLKRYFAYRRKHGIGNVDNMILGLEDTNRLIVASGSSYSQHSALVTIMAKAQIPDNPPYTLQLDLLNMLSNDLVQTARGYGYDIEWHGQYKNPNLDNRYATIGVLELKIDSILPVAYTVREERLFDWLGLFYLSVEHVANKHMALVKKIKADNRRRLWIATK